MNLLFRPHMAWWPRLILVAAMLVYVVVMSRFSIGRANNFNAGWYDLGIMTQVVWNVGHGRGLVFTNPEAGPGGYHGLITPRTSIHTDYILALLAPFSWWPGHTTELLLIFQSLVLAAGAWFVYRIARAVGFRSWPAVGWGVVYLLYPPLQFANLFEFHAVTLAVTFLLAAADAAIRGRWKWWWIWAGLALITKEQVGLTAGLIGAWLWWRAEHRWRRPVTVLAICFIWTAIQMLVVIPLSRPGQSGSFTYDKFYRTAGTDAGSIFSRLAQPRLVYDKLATKRHAQNIKELVTPLGVIAPLASPIIWLGVPEALIYWLSDSPNQQTLVMHYHALLIPMLFTSALLGAGWLLRRGRKFHPRGGMVVGTILVATISLGTINAVRTASPWPWSPLSRWNLVTWKEKLAPQVAQALKLVPAGAPAAFTQNLGPFLAERSTAELLPNGIRRADYLMILERKFDPLIKTNDKRYAEQTMLIQFQDWLRDSPSYQELYHVDRVHVWRRLGVPAAVEPVWPEGLLGR